MTFLKKSTLGLSTVIIASILGAYSQTALAAPASLGLTISPPSFDINTNPGDTLNDTIRITNNSASNVTLQVTTQDFTVTGTEGTVDVVNDTSATATSKWFSFPAAQIKLGAQASALVPFTIDVPKNAEPGGHYATILFNPVATGSSPSTGASVVQRVGSLVLITVSGDIIEAGSIAQFHTKTFLGSYATVLGSDNKTRFLLATSEDLKDERSTSYFDHGPIAFDVVFRNSGNVHFLPTGTVSIYDIFGHKVYQTPIDPREVFPGGERRITVIWPAHQLWGGYYRAEVAAVYGSQNSVLTATTVFWAFPLYMIIIIIVVIILLILLRRRLLFALKALVKGR